MPGLRVELLALVSFAGLFFFLGEINLRKQLNLEKELVQFFQCENSTGKQILIRKDCPKVRIKQEGALVKIKIYIYIYIYGKFYAYNIYIN